KKYADGRVFTGRQAKQYGFVDTLGTLEDAIDIAAHLAGIHGKSQVIKEYRRQGLMDRILGSSMSEIAQLREQVLHQPVLQYRFTTPF
ncbi:MAG TPA: S49 family peptidase, partial [Terriglobia bacterium]|nr:S49 family peptidase [Terriglobia bacterium]